MLHAFAYSYSSDQERNMNTVWLCTHCAHTHTCSHVSAFRHIVTPARLESIHTDTPTSTQTIKTPGHAPSCAHSCTNTQTRAAHAHAHMHSCVQPTDTGGPTQAHTGPSCRHITRKSGLTHARVSQLHSGPHLPTHTHKTCNHEYMGAHTHPRTCSCLWPQTTHPLTQVRANTLRYTA